MKYLYVDNFRGFTDTYIPIKDVNFLVGENSTGKTSILSLINLLGSPRFWFNQEFNTDEVHLGHFRDIVSANATDKSYFQIGAIECPVREEDDETQPKRVNMFLMTFTGERGLPAIASYTYVSEQNQITVFFYEKTMRLKISQVEFPCESVDGALRLFGLWRNESRARQASLGGSKVVRFAETPFGRKNALPFVAMLFGEGSSQDALSMLLTPMDLGVPTFASNLAWLAPIRSKPKRTYDSYRLDPTPEGDHAPYVIRRILSQKTSAERFKSYVEQFGNESGLFDSVFIKSLGRGSAAPFELGIVLNENPLNISYVGYGVSQSLPVIVELFARPKGFWYAIQQPEVHLHPRAQAALGDLLYALATAEKKKFFIETHSDYTIDRFRLNFQSDDEEEVDSQVLFFERDETGNQIQCIDIKENGDYSDDQPRSFREFFVNESLRLLEIEDVHNN